MLKKLKKLICKYRGHKWGMTKYGDQICVRCHAMIFDVAFQDLYYIKSEGK